MSKIKTKKGSLAWALVQLAKGLKVRPKEWEHFQYIYMENNSLLFENKTQVFGSTLNNQEWVLYDESK